MKRQIGISIDKEDIQKIESLIKQGVFDSKPAFIRIAIKEKLKKHETLILS